MTDFKYDTTFQGGYNPSTPSGEGVPEYNNVGQLRTPYFGKRYGIVGDYGPIYNNPFNPHRLNPGKYAQLEMTHTPIGSEGPDLSYPSPFAPPNMIGGIFRGYPSHAPPYERPPDIKFIRGDSLIGAVVFPGNMGRIPVRDGVGFYASHRKFQ
jgi:hypothetical protein